MNKLELKQLGILHTINVIQDKLSENNCLIKQEYLINAKNKNILKLTEINKRLSNEI